MPVPVVITAFGDRTFTFVTKTPPVTYFLKKAAGVAKGSPTPAAASPARSPWRSAARSPSQDEGHERPRPGAARVR